MWNQPKYSFIGLDINFSNSPGKSIKETIHFHISKEYFQSLYSSLSHRQDYPIPLYNIEATIEGNEALRSALFESYSLLKYVEKLLPELIDRIITTALFLELLGSHAALYILKSLSREAKYPTFRDRIIIIFKSKSLRE